VNSIEFLLLFRSQMAVGLACVAVSCVVFGVLLRRCVLSAFDPLFLGAMAHTFAAAVMGFLWVQDLIEPYYLWSYLLTEVAFWAGFFSFARPVRLVQVRAEGLAGEVTFLRFYYCMVVLLVGSVAAFVAKAGLLITQDVSRLVVMQEMGWISWLYDGTSMSVPVLVLLKRYVLDKKSRADWLVLGVVLFALGTKGGKSDFIVLCFSVFLVGWVFSLPRLLRALKVFYVAAPLALFAATALVLSAWSVEMSVTELVLGRLILFGDAFFQGYDRLVFDSLPETNLFRYFFGSIADVWSSLTGPGGQSRVVLGYEWSKYYGFDEGEGPNARHNILGLYLCGFYGAIAFSFVCGAFVAFVRTRLLPVMRSVGRVAAYLTANIAAMYVMIDPSLAVGYLLKLVIVWTIAYLCAAALGVVLRERRLCAPLEGVARE
jgi:hypothetical protein